MCSHILLSFLYFLQVISKKCVDFKRRFLLKAHSTEQAPSMKVFPSGARFSDDSTEAMRITLLAHGYSILMQPGFEP